ncbi:hypothetical protein H6F32_08885 [Anabaena sp. FACHB-1237]|uniref:CRISPR-associated protein Csx18 n=1 Tax=Anabaena sp. FACHB-1237 TaxID=2692769 RepID=UPI0016819EE2|nr:CRISPR-associated protein Csx18 [Anabaena sp. FACHB-1237]MBD2137698.1 hypothetical protein [Anabaena sp. FACHB-1237]
MCKSVSENLVKSRNYAVAFANGGVTLIILIISRLSLLTVIICTLSVFLSSLIIGWICDKPLYQLISDRHRGEISTQWESDNIEFISEEHENLPN